MPEPFETNCVMDHMDKLLVSSIPIASTIEIEVHTTTYKDDGGRGFDSAMVRLDADRARQLFRWLGAWLHETGEL